MSNLHCVVNSYNNHFKGQRVANVLEIGSRDGHDAYFLFLKFNPLNVYTFEANPDCHQIIKNNYPGFNNIYGAVSNFTGEASFNMVTSNNWEAVGTSSLKDRTDSWYDGKSSKITVPVDTMQNYIKNNSINPPFDIVKIDTEGCSYEVIEGFGKKIHQVKVIHVENETHAYWSEQKLAHEVSELLQSKGFFKDYEENFGENSVDEVWINGNFIQ